jgi:predicted permease
MQSSFKELRYIGRRLLRSPAFAAISVLTLAVGIGANTAIFSVVNGVILRPLPYPDSEQLVGLWHSAPGIGIPEFNQSETTYKLYSELNRTFAGIGLYDNLTLNLIDGGEPVRLQSASASSSLFRVLAVPPALGRVFTEEDDRLGGAPIVVLSDEFWKRRFGSDPSIVGRTIVLDGEALEVIGIMPAGFGFPDKETQLWVPHRIDPADLGLANFNCYAIGRLGSGVVLETAEADLNRLLPQLPEVYPGEFTAALMENAQIAAQVNSLHEDEVGDVAQILWILLGTVGFVLLIACANVANLFLVRAEGRQREVAVRTALGAGWGDLVRYFLAESITLAILGGIVGLGLAYAGIQLLVTLSPGNIPRLDEVGLHGTVLIFTGAISIVAGLLFGAMPILRYGRPNLVTSLKEGGRGGSSGRQTHKARNLLVVSQVALALVLLVGSGLMVRSFWSLRNVDPGFDAEGILTLRLSLPETEYSGARDVAAFHQRLLETIRVLPGVEVAGAITNLPMTDTDSNSGVTVEDFPVAPGEIPPVIRTNVAAPGYFEAMGIALQSGRTFERRDHEEVTGAVVVSRGFEPDENETRWWTIVGVVGDVRDDGLQANAPEMIYYPMVSPGGDDEAGWIPNTMSFAIRTAVPPTTLATPIRQAIWSLDPHLPIANVQTTAAIVSDSTARTAFTMLLLTIAAAVALLLGTVGIYGVVSYVVSQRTREIGVRMALGATQGEVGRMVVRQGLAIASAGVVIGLIGAFALTRLMSALLFGVSSTDPMTFAAVAALLFAVTVAASYIPARRAAGVDPMEALRYE